MKNLYSKEQLVKSDKYKHLVDILNTILEDDKSYSLDDVDKMINKFLKKGGR